MFAASIKSKTSTVIHGSFVAVLRPRGLVHSFELDRTRVHRTPMSQSRLAVWLPLLFQSNCFMDLLASVTFPPNSSVDAGDFRFCSLAGLPRGGAGDLHQRERRHRLGAGDTE